MTEVELFSGHMVSIPTLEVLVMDAVRICAIVVGIILVEENSFKMGNTIHKVIGMSLWTLGSIALLAGMINRG